MMNLDLPDKRTLFRCGKLAFVKIRKRVRDQGRMANGAPVPKLRSKGRFLADRKDETLGGGGKPVHVWNAKVRPAFRGERHGNKKDRVRTLYNSYGRAKIAAGRKPRKDGFLTGHMWSSPGLRIKVGNPVKARSRFKEETGKIKIMNIRGREHTVVVFFSGSSKTIDGGWKRTKGGKRKRKTVPTRTKAKAVGRRGNVAKAAKPEWDILGISPKEMKEVAAVYERALVNGFH